MDKNNNKEWDLRLKSDWYSPTRLHNSPVQYDFPGDRFIPNRSLMNIDQANAALTNRTKKEPSKPKLMVEYQRNLDNLKVDGEGRPFQMMVFRGSPKSKRSSNRLIEEMRRSDGEVPVHKTLRRFPKKESNILDAPNLRDDYYVNVLDWGKTNILALALGPKIYLWNVVTRDTSSLPEIFGDDDFPTSVSWSEDGRTVAAGHDGSSILLYDAETLKLLRCFDGHHGRVGCISWNGYVLTSGSYDRAIINNDVRVMNSMISCVKGHKHEVCGLKWSSTGNVLASGGNDNLVYIWDACKMSSMHNLYKLNDHRSAVKALAWCPYQDNMLASGGGTTDGCLKIWNLRKGKCIRSIETKAQICGLQWNRHHKEILSGHGYGTEGQNKICLWQYPSMSKIGESESQMSRVLHLSQSPDGLTVAAAVGDYTLRFWEVFGPPLYANSRISYLDSLLSLKTSPIR